MSEVVPNQNSNILQLRQGELFTEREALEALNKEQLVNFILEKGELVTEAERMMNLAAQVLDGYGTTIEKELDKRNG